MRPGHLSLQGFSAPVVKGDFVQLPVVTGTQERVVIWSTPGLLRQIIRELDAALPAAAAVSGKPAAVGQTADTGAVPVKTRVDSRGKIYRQIEAAHAAAPHIALSELCRQAGAKPSAYYVWRAYQRTHAKTAAGAPLTKPSGQLL